MKSELKKQLEKRCLLAIPLLQNIIKKYIKDYNDQCDALQEIMLIAWRKLPELNEPYNIEGWLSTITRNHCLGWLKKQTKNITLHDESIIATDEQADNTITRDEYELLIGGINKLSYLLRTVIQMKYFTHNSIKDISKLLKLPEGTVKRRLHDARLKLKKEFRMNNKKVAPEVTVTTINKDELAVKRLGYGLNFGCPLAGVGDVEIYEAYEYPGRILINKFATEVTQITKIMGQEVIEVHSKSIIKENSKGTERYLYYQFNDDILTMVFRISNFIDNLKIDTIQDDLMNPQVCSISTGTEKKEKDNLFSINDVVELHIGEKVYHNVLRSRISLDDYHGRSFMEKFYAENGREVLHRNYIGENWKMGDYVKWEKWKDAPETTFNGEKFRLWFEFILVDNYTKEQS